MYYKIKHDSEYLQQIMTIYKWYERLVIYTLTIQSECSTDKHKTDLRTIQTFTQLAVHFTLLQSQLSHSSVTITTPPYSAAQLKITLL